MFSWSLISVKACKYGAVSKYSIKVSRILVYTTSFQLVLRTISTGSSVTLVVFCIYVGLYLTPVSPQMNLLTLIIKTSLKTKRASNPQTKQQLPEKVQPILRFTLQCCHYGQSRAARHLLVCSLSQLCVWSLSFTYYYDPYFR